MISIFYKYSETRVRKIQLYIKHAFNDQLRHYGNVTIALCTSYEEDQFYLSHTSTHGWYTYVISHTPHLADKQIYIISHLISHISDTYSYVIYCIWHTPHMADVYFTNSTKGWYKDQAGPSTDSLFCFCCLLICCLKSIQIYNNLSHCAPLLS